MFYVRIDYQFKTSELKNAYVGWANSSMVKVLLEWTGNVHFFQFPVRWSVKEALPSGWGVARLNFKTSRVGVYKCFMSLSESERSLFWKWTLVARLNFRTSRIGVYKCFMSLSESERKFLVFVGILEKGIEMRSKETITIVQFLSYYVERIEHLYIAIHNWVIHVQHFKTTPVTDLINREGTVVYSVRAVGRSVVRLPASCSLHCRQRRVAYKKLKSGSHCPSSPIVGTTIIMLAGDWKPCDVLTSRSWRCSIFELVASRYI